MLRVPSNITAPAAITLVFRNPTFGPDLTLVNAGVLNVTRRDGTTATWTLSIVSQTPSELVVQYVFTGGAEIAGNGVYYLAPAFTIPGGTIPGTTVAMFVTPPNSLNPQTEDSGWIAAATLVLSGGPVKYSGTTANRPTGAVVGFQYFDTTLGIPVFWKGVVWVNAAGTTV